MKIQKVRKPRRITILIIVFMAFKSIAIFAQENDNYINLSEVGKDCLKFSCKVKTSNELTNPIDVMLFLNNKIMDHRKLEKSKNFNLILKRDAYYIIQISTPFYITRYIIINTKIPEKIEQGRSLYKHEMEIELFKEPQIYYTPTINSDVLDEAVTIIKYKLQEDKFDCDLRYTSKIKRDLRKFKKSVNKLIMDQSKE